VTENLYEAMFPDETRKIDPVTEPALAETVAMPPQDRPSWDAYFMEIARAVSQRATCPRRAVGAVVVKDKRILSTGYNGSPPGHPHCTDEGCIMDEGNHCVRVIHAEANAVLQGAKYGMRLEGATCYCTTLPCLPCAKLLIGAGIVEVTFDSDYRPDPLLEQFKLKLTRL
jgi:dCMP deaminase